MMRTILLVEDEIAISKVLRMYLEKAGYQVVQVFDGDLAIPVFEKEHPHLVLLDVMLPGRDGWSILKEIRARGACPVIMLTALGDTSYKLSGLREGADDYLTKPFVSEEVVARVQAVLRRSAHFYEGEGVQAYGNLKIDFRSHAVFLHGVQIELSPRDLSLLLFLAQSPNRTYTREQLIEHVWGMDYDGSDRAVDLAVKRVRQSLRNWPESQGEIKTLRGLGYQFSVHTNRSNG